MSALAMHVRNLSQTDKPFKNVGIPPVLFHVPAPATANDPRNQAPETSFANPKNSHRKLKGMDADVRG